MKKIITIGRNGDQNFPITSNAVSNQHARITIEDEKWILEDLDSTNGTFVRNDQTGDFERIACKHISEDTVIRLGCNGRFNEVVFMAHHVTEEDPNDYSWEMSQVINSYKKNIKTVQDIIYKKNDRREILSIVFGLVGFGLSCLVSNIWLVRLCTMLPPMLITFLFMGTAKKMRKLQELRNKIIVCPKCNRQLSDQELHDHCCSKCQAHT